MGSAVKAWDFTQARELASSLAASQPAAAAGEPTSAAQNTTDVAVAGAQREHISESPQALGDFSRVFYFLGTPNHVPRASNDTKLDYASDGAAYLGRSSTGREAHNGPQYETDIDDGNIATDRSATPPPPSPITNIDVSKTMSKKARQRRNKRIRKEAKEASAHLHTEQLTVSDSEADEKPMATPARKASLHILPGGSPATLHSQGRTSSAGNFGSIGSGTKAIDFSSANELRSPAKHDRNAPLSPVPDESLPEPLPESRSEPWTAHCDGSISNTCHQSTARTPPRADLRLTPASIQPTPKRTPNLTTPQKPTTPSPLVRIAQFQDKILPIVARSDVDRHLALFHKLLTDFKEDAEHLVAPMNLTTHNNHPNGIHVFVDASNIFIGFMDVLKRSRGIAQHRRVSRKHPSFGALALLMEHRRPVAKRVLVGSEPEVTAFQQARAVGYECNILTRVWKQRELTPRQIYFRDRNAGLIAPGTKPPQHGASGDNHGYSTSSDTATAQYAPGAYVEQGVDEILHLKIMESIVDFPPSTMILATGDAAQAEYSDGFKVMVERALNRGWKVELVSWSKNISHQYRDARFRQKWGQQLKIIELDDYAEELLDA